MTENHEPQITIIEETPLSQLPDANKWIEHLSPSIISAATPKAATTSTPNLESIKPNKTQIQYPELYKNGKLIQPQKIQETALKMTQKLAKLNYRDTGFLSNATNEERNK